MSNQISSTQQLTDVASQKTMVINNANVDNSLRQVNVKRRPLDYYEKGNNNHWGYCPENACELYIANTLNNYDYSPKRRIHRELRKIIYFVEPASLSNDVTAIVVMTYEIPSLFLILLEQPDFNY